MTMFDVRLAFRLHRFEVIVFGILVALLSIGAVVTAVQLDATGFGPKCWNDPQGLGCEAMMRAFNDLEPRALTLKSILALMPYLLGVLLGAPLVARELERGTSRLAWSLAPSRVRWFVVRVVPAMVVVVTFSVVAGTALDRLAGAVEPARDMANSFADFGGRGVVLAARATFVFTVGVTTGVVLGRTLPTILVAAVIGSVGIAGGSYVHGKILAAEAVWVADTGNGSANDLYFEQRIQLADGRLVSWDEAMALAQTQPADASTGDGLPPGAKMLALVVPGTRYGFVQAREVGALAGGGLVALGIGALAVRRRRPG